jgi:hypothetical protein
VFNPNQGQGMSVAATEAGILRKCLNETTLPELLPKRFFAAQAEFQINPRRLAVCNDLRFTSVQGEHTPPIRFFNWYREQLALSPDRRVQQRLGEVDLLLKPVASIFDPLIMLRVLASPLRPTQRGAEMTESRFGPMPPTLVAAF